LQRCARDPVSFGHDHVPFAARSAREPSFDDGCQRLAVTDVIRLEHPNHAGFSAKDALTNRQSARVLGPIRITQPLWSQGIVATSRWAEEHVA
jgi:hypothetical protein